MAGVLWKIGSQLIDVSQRGMLMGVLNVTPDSFSDGGEFFGIEPAVEHGLQMIEEGADIIDIGGESTRPGADAVSESEELERVVPVILKLRAAVPAVLISIDTSKANVARAALDAGAQIINDITGLRGDEKMMPLAAERGAGLIIMHMQGTPRTMQASPHYEDVVAEVRDFFRQQYARALECGIDPMTMAFDPGIGFGKTLDHNLELLGNLAHLRIENQPLVVGVSRKSFLARILGAAEPGIRLAPTVALTALLRERGANVLRVHDVKPNTAALRTAEALRANR
ncbi:MAG: dihydropteroate synthase [Chthoniobacterales bacterium]|nr:dihydropteroate synthase [Chthoniobacterales bacterium]